MRVLRRDRPLWGEGGGVTLGGGDPLAQLDFSREILAACSAEGMHTALETCAHAPREDFLSLLRHARWVFIDLKHMDADKHRRGTGMDNRLILGNIRALRACGWDGTLMIRLPLIPGYNDDADNLARTAAFVKEVGLREINILPYHRLGESKYEQLGVRSASSVPASPRSLAAACDVFAATGIACHAGSDTPF